MARRSRNDRWGARLSLVVALTLIPVASGDLPEASLDERRDAIERSMAEMTGTTGSELQARLQSTGLLSSDSPMLAAIVLQAGRELPPGLSAARRAQRQARAAGALEWLRKGLDEPASAAATKDALAQILDTGPAGGAEPHSMPEVARAAMNVAASLDLIEFAPRIAGFLDAGPTVAATARGALLRLTGRNFASAVEFRALWPRLDGLGSAALGRDDLLAATARADGLAIQLLEFAPDAVEGEPLAFADQGAVARGSAAILRSVAGRRLPPDRALEWLGDGVADEARPRAFAARLSAMCDLIQGADPESDPARFVARRVQGLLARGRALHPDLAWATLATLPRLVLPAAPGGGDAARERLLGQGLALLERCVDADRYRPHDPDGLQGAVAALIDLARSIEDDDLRASASRPLVERLTTFVTTERPLQPSVRRAAASGLRLSLRPEDAQMLLGLVESLSTPELEYELLGALRAAIAVLPPGGDEAEELLDRLFEISVAQNFDRKMRALVVLASEDAAEALQAKPREHRARWILKRFETETEAEVHRAFLGILARIGNTPVLEQLTADPASLRWIAARGGGEDTMAAFEETVRVMAGEDASRLRRAAGETLAAGFFGSHSDSTPGRRPEELALMRSGLRLALEADALGGSEATAADHVRIVRAGLELLRLEPVAGIAAFDLATLVQIRAKHGVPLAQAASDLYAFESAAAEALIAARLALREPELGLTPVQVVAAYDAALRVFGADGPPSENGGEGEGATAPAAKRFGWSTAALEIDLIGYLRAAEPGDRALARIDAWIAGRPADIGPLPASVRRTYCELALDLAGSRPEELTLGRATRVLDHLDNLAAEAESQGEDPGARSAVTWLAGIAAAGRPGGDVLARVASSADSERYKAVMDRVSGLMGEGEEPESSSGGG